MKHGPVIALLLGASMAVCGCSPPREAAPPPQRSARVERLVANTHSIIVVAEGEARYITNRVGQVMIGHPMQTVGTTTSRQEIAELAAALAETGMYGDSGVCFCGALPSHIFLDADGEPLVSVLVHTHHNHVILSTNLTRIGEQIFDTYPTGERFEGEAPLPSGDNPRYGRLALQLVKRIWPEECVRRELKGCEDLIDAHKKAEAQREDKERLEHLLHLSRTLGGTTAESTPSSEPPPPDGP